MKGGLKSFFWTIGRLYAAGACTILRDAESGNAESVCWELLLAWGLPKPAVALANRLSCCLHSGSSWAANFASIIVLIVMHGICCSESNNATGPQLLQCMSRQAALQKRTLPSLQAGHNRNSCSHNSLGVYYGVAHLLAGNCTLPMFPVAAGCQAALRPPNHHY